MYAVTFYDMDADAGPALFDRVREVYPRHRAYLDAFARGGEILLIGPLGPTPAGGAMAIFRSREAAERFVADDPFVTEGLAQSHRIVDWDPLVFAES